MKCRLNWVIMIMVHKSGPRGQPLDVAGSAHAHKVSRYSLLAADGKPEGRANRARK